jgi:putative hydrolase of the HAD superfamily
VESIRRWWEQVGRHHYPQAARLLITADSGGSNGSRLRLWRTELATLAAQAGLEITVAHFPPGTSKWNKVEHRLFSFSGDVVDLRPRQQAMVSLGEPRLGRSEHYRLQETRPGEHLPYPDVVARVEACLVDAYETIVTCDFTAHRSVLPALAGIPADAMYQEFARISPALSTGQLAMAEAFGQILRACGAEPQPDLLRQLVEKDHELLLASARLFDDVIPFLETLRCRAIKTAIVSNCDEKTRDLLSELGVAALADELVLSCEVGAAKPSPRIFGRALGRLGVTADAALFVDDNAGYCAGAADLGMSAVQMVRGEMDGKVPVTGIPVVRSLAEVEAMLSDR